jgi:Transposase DNA-binding
MKLKNFTDLNAWAVEQWGDAELGDSRRTDRAMPAAGYAYAVGAAIAANPEASLPNIISGWNEVRAAYRLFAEEDVTHTELKKSEVGSRKTFVQFCNGDLAQSQPGGYSLG